MTVTALPTNKSEWLASLELDLVSGPFGTQITKTVRQGPLSVQKAFYPEGKACAHIYLLHPPAGIVSGDDLSVFINLDEQAHGLITTPGANRFYRAREDQTIGDTKQVLNTHMNLADHAKCEHFPLETIVYESADAENNVTIQLQESSVYCGWDITCLGLPSAAQLFEQGKFTQVSRILCADKLIYHDRISISPDSGFQDHPAGLNKLPVFGTFLAYISDQTVNSLDLSLLIQALRQKVDDINRQESVSITHVRNVLIMRYLGCHAEECKDVFIALWQIIRPVYMEKQAIAPRIWHT